MIAKSYWTEVAQGIARPVLTHLANRTLRLRMPGETSGDQGRREASHLEAFGRLLAGIGPWLELGEPAALPFAALAREALDSGTDPGSSDCFSFTASGQALVDTAFLAQGLLRAPKALWEPLEERVKQNVIRSLRATRAICPHPSNWLLFSAMVETALHAFGVPDWDPMRIDYALRQHEQWYKGDSFYGDGPSFHADYYNSFVILPMLMDVIRHFPDQPQWAPFQDRIRQRSTRHAAILERMISPEGTFPPIGRSLTYRFGAMQTLSQTALLHALPKEVAPAQVREALGTVIRRMMQAPGTFDDDGWLRIGFCGHQPRLGENYISTGSLYLCSVGLLPLGLPETDPFWIDPDAPWSSMRAWGGLDLPIDHAISD